MLFRGLGLVGGTCALWSVDGAVDDAEGDAPEEALALPDAASAPGGRSMTAVDPPPPLPVPVLALLPDPGRIGPLRLLRAFGGVAATFLPVCPAAATLMDVLRLAASTAEYQPLESPRLARRLAICTQRSSRCFIMQSTGEAMKIDEYAPDNNPMNRARP